MDAKLPVAAKSATIPAPAPAPAGAAAPLLSVAIKVLNGEAHIARCLRAVREATAGLDAEVIVADSLSTDRTVDIARTFPVTVVQLADPRDRSCGAGGQLGFAAARGRYFLALDADMALHKPFLQRAIAALQEDPGLAGVCGTLIERSTILEFRERGRRKNPNLQPGDVQALYGHGLYRMDALRATGYFTDRNLHCREEFELGARLRAGGWRLQRLAEPAADHYGYTISSWALLWRRWQGRYFTGYGELLRGAWGKPWFGRALATSWLFIAVIAWWLALAAGLATAAVTASALALGVAAVIFALPAAVMLVRKRNLFTAAYAVALWNFHAAGLLAGLLHRRVSPEQPLPHQVLKVHPHAE